MSYQYIAVATPELQRCALAEMSAVAPGLHWLANLEQGTFLVETAQKEDVFLPALARAEPVFVKHIMPAQRRVPLARRKVDDLPILLRVAQDLGAVRAGDHFTVQCRRVGKGFDYTAKDVEVLVGMALEACGATPVFCDTDLRPLRGQSPTIDQYPDSELILEDWHKVVFYYLLGDTAYAGASTIVLSLNEHCDENRVFARRSRDVCRSEFKLLEALRRFKVDLAPGRALDLGAAPGGWAKVLADRGLHVTAVDPATLDLKAADLPNVIHIRQRAEEFAPTGVYDLLVNDMVLPADRSAAIMLHTAPHLKYGASAIMTIKLGYHTPCDTLQQTLATLGSAFEVVHAKCLFHNRQEATVMLRRARPEPEL